MKPRDLDVECFKKILADIERNCSDPQIAALMEVSGPASSERRNESTGELAMTPIPGLD